MAMVTVKSPVTGKPVKVSDTSPIAIRQLGQPSTPASNQRSGIDIPGYGGPSSDATSKVISQRVAEAKGTEVVPEKNTITTTSTPTYSAYNGMTQQQYMDNSREIAKQNAISQYDATLSDLKSRVAKIIADQNLAKRKAESDYQKNISANEGARYQAQKGVDQVLARRGLLNTGIDVGNDRATQMQYDVNKQDIDLARQGQMDTIQNEIDKANIQQQYDENKIAQQKAAYLAGQDAQAFKDYNDYALKVYGTNADNFWRGIGAGQAQQGLQLQEKNMNQNYALGNAQLQQQNSQFQQTYNQNQQFHNDDTIFRTKQLEQQNTQFLQQMGLSRDQFNEGIRQYNETMKFNEKQLNQEYDLAQQQMKTSIQVSENSTNAALARLDWEKQQFDAASQALGMNPQLYTVFSGVKDNVFAQIKDLMANNKGKYETGKEMVDAMDAIIKSSNLPLDWQVEIQKVVKNSYQDPQNGGNLINPSTTPGGPQVSVGPTRPTNGPVFPSNNVAPISGTTQGTGVSRPYSSWLNR